MYTIAIGVVGQAIMVGLSLGNYGFYGFYGTPFSPLVFGLFQDDTEAILVTLWKDWPIFFIFNRLGVVDDHSYYYCFFC